MKVYLMFFLTILMGCNNPPKADRTKNIAGAHTKDSNRVSVDSGYKNLSLYHGDTAKYIIENFIRRKHVYLNKPLSVLLKKLEVPIVRFVPFNNGSDIIQNDGVYLDFFSDASQNYKIKHKIDPATMLIYWDTSISENDLSEFRKKINGGWSVEEIKYFKDLIISNIDSMKYRFNTKQPTIEELDTMKDVRLF